MRASILLPFISLLSLSSAHTPHAQRHEHNAEKRGESWGGFGISVLGSAANLAGALIRAEEEEVFLHATWRLADTLGYRLKVVYGGNHVDGEGRTVRIPVPHEDEMEHYPQQWEINERIFNCIKNQEHGDEAWCVNEASCCAGVKKACDNLGVEFCKACRWEEPKLYVYDGHSHDNHKNDGWGGYIKEIKC